MTRIVAWPGLFCALVLAGCASSGAGVDITAQATGSAYFTLSRPSVYSSNGGLEIAGRVCRRARGTLLSPSRVRLEHVGAGGTVVDLARAGVPAIHRNVDQPCADYSTKVDWRMLDGESIRACFERGRACPADAASKAVIAVPAAPPAPPAPQ